MKKQVLCRDFFATTVTGGHFDPVHLISAASTVLIVVIFSVATDLTSCQSGPTAKSLALATPVRSPDTTSFKGEG